MKVLFYCQYLQGIGHLTRAKNICQQLSSKLDTTLICGGPKIELGQNFKIEYISPFLMEPDSKELFVPEQKESVEDNWKLREKQLCLISNNYYDALIVEYFPFGRYKFKNEILSFIEKLKKQNPKIKIILSLRDIVLEREDKIGRREKIVNILNQYFDFILYHSDPNYFKIEDFYSGISSQINIPIYYTGFVTESLNHSQARERENTILISNGGGSVGDEIFKFSFTQLDKYPQHTFRYIISPYLPESIRKEVFELSKTHNNIHIVSFSNQYEEELLKAKISLSTSGYNTLLNHVSTQTPAIFWPYQDNLEQELRVKTFSKFFPFIDAFNTLNLDQKFEEMLKNKAPKQDFKIDLEGAKNSLEIIMKNLGVNQ